MRSPIRAISLRFLISLCIIQTCVACAAPAATLNPLYEKIPLANDQSVSLSVDNAAISLSNAPATDLILAGEVSSQAPESFSIEQSTGPLKITLAEERGWSFFDRPPDDLNIQMPQDNHLSISAFDGSISIQDYQGSLEVHLVTGEISASDIKGEIALISSRGNIAVRGGEGALRVLGEHGLLTLADVHGKVGSATIMGTIRLDAEPRAGDEMRLEADHGPIEVFLGKNANLTLLARSNSGDVTCVIPGITQEGRGCQGRLGNGESSLWIRTVSGGITIQLKPEGP